MGDTQRKEGVGCDAAHRGCIPSSNCSIDLAG